MNTNRDDRTTDAGTALAVPPVSARARPRFIEGAHRRGADALILDLEDSVPFAEKNKARAALPASITSVGRDGAAAMVRVNHGLRAVARDLEAAVVPGLAALVLPKVEEAGYVARLPHPWPRSRPSAVSQLGRYGSSSRSKRRPPSPARRDRNCTSAHRPRSPLGPEDYAAAHG